MVRTLVIIILIFFISIFVLFLIAWFIAGLIAYKISLNELYTICFEKVMSGYIPNTQSGNLLTKSQRTTTATIFYTTTRFGLSPSSTLHAESSYFGLVIGAYVVDYSDDECHHINKKCWFI